MEIYKGLIRTSCPNLNEKLILITQKTFNVNNMEEVGKIVEEILKYLIKEEESVRKEDIKDKFGLEEEKIDTILKFLQDLKLIKMNNQIVITELGLKYLQM